MLLDVCLTDLGDTLSFIVRFLLTKKSLISESAKIYTSHKHTSIASLKHFWTEM